MDVKAYQRKPGNEKKPEFRSSSNWISLLVKGEMQMWRMIETMMCVQEAITVCGDLEKEWLQGHVIQSKTHKGWWPVSS